MQGFLEVARRGNVSRAAEAIYVSQPTLTARLHALETELGEKLFVRTRQGMRLTDAGRAFLPYAERATQAVKEGREAIAELNSASAGHLVIASAPAVSTYLLPPLLERFAGAHPRVEVAVRTGHSEEVLQMVLKSEVQLGLGRDLRHHDIDLIPFYEEELGLMVAPGHHFAERRSVTMADLSGEQLILFDRTSSYYELTQASFASAGLTPRSMFELDNIEATKKTGRAAARRRPPAPNRGRGRGCRGHAPASADIGRAAHAAAPRGHAAARPRPAQRRREGVRRPPPPGHRVNRLSLSNQSEQSI